MSEKCPKCGTPLVNIGAPIWENYCPAANCTHGRDTFLAGVKMLVQQSPEAEITRLRARVAELEEALKPFQDLVVYNIHKAHLDGHIEDDDLMLVRVGYLRRACDALEKRNG
jgi:hypothetical protein